MPATSPTDILFKIAQSEIAFLDARFLFEEYASSLGVDLSFQGFENELKNIDKQYDRPDGVLIIGYCNNVPVGCVAIRKLENSVAELKRMYVKPLYHGRGIGSKLLTLSLETAVDLNYCTIRLDTLPDMKEAQNLYKKFGFYEIPSYRFNPIAGTVFMEKNLFNISLTET